MGPPEHTESAARPEHTPAGTRATVAPLSNHIISATFLRDPLLPLTGHRAQSQNIT
jgi:hypothetical protein